MEIDMETHDCSTVGRRVPWNKGRLTGQNPPLKLREIWGIRTRMQMSSNVRALAMLFPFQTRELRRPNGSFRRGNGHSRVVVPVG
jgi:hypothetical protein